jgi:hypothetical protein
VIDSSMPSGMPAPEPLPTRDPGATFRKTPATVGKPKPKPKPVPAGGPR